MISNGNITITLFVVVVVVVVVEKDSHIFSTKNNSVFYEVNKLEVNDSVKLTKF